MLIRDAVFRVFDTETTGFDPETEAVCEIASVDVVPFQGVLMDRTMQDLVFPGKPIPPEASAVHHLIDADVARARKLDEVLDHYKAGWFIPAAHNAAFDSAFLPGIEGPWLCTQRLASHLLPQAPSHANQVLRYWLGLKPRLPKDTPAHRALADAVVSAELLNFLLLRFMDRFPELATVEQLIEFADAPIEQRHIRFGKHRGTPWAELPSDYLAWMHRKGDWDPDTAHTLRLEIQRRRSQ